MARNIISGAGAQARQLSDEASLVLWEIICDYLERHQDAEPGTLALRLLTASLELADTARAGRLCEDGLLQAKSLGGLAESSRRLEQDGEPISQGDIIRELISAYQDDPEIVARLEEFLAKYLSE